MKRFLTLLLVVAATLGAQAQLLWKVSGNGLDKPSYLFGTYHLASLGIKDSIAALPQVQQDVQQVYGEVIMADMMKPETLMKMQQQMMLPADTTLKSLFSPEEFEVVTQAVKEYLQVDIALLDRMKPAALSQQLTVLFYLKHTPGYNPQEQLDASFQQDATKTGSRRWTSSSISRSAARPKTCTASSAIPPRLNARPRNSSPPTPPKTWTRCSA